MDPTVTPIAAARGIRILHGALVAGLVLVGGTCVLLLRSQARPLGGAPNVGVLLAGTAVALLIVASLVLRRSVPERRPDQSPDDYWAGTETRGACILLWAVVDGSGLVGWVGYVLTGEAAPAAAAALAIAALIVFRPSRLEGEG
jgi:hypothetical protein